MKTIETKVLKFQRSLFTHYTTQYILFHRTTLREKEDIVIYRNVECGVRIRILSKNSSSEY